MIRSIVTQDQILQHGHEGQRILDGKTAIQSLFQGAIESLHDAGFGVSTGREMMDIFLFNQSLEVLVVKFFAIIRLKVLRLATLTSFQNLLKGDGHVMSSLGLDGFYPGILGKRVDHCQ